MCGVVWRRLGWLGAAALTSFALWWALGSTSFWSYLFSLLSVSLSISLGGGVVPVVYALYRYLYSLCISYLYSFFVLAFPPLSASLTPLLSISMTIKNVI